MFEFSSVKTFPLKKYKSNFSIFQLAGTPYGSLLEKKKSTKQHFNIISFKLEYFRITVESLTCSYHYFLQVL